MNESEEKLSPKRRFALVTYLAILFAVAFLLVALMLVAETRRLKTMNEELKDSSQKTSASLTNNINALQEENTKLSEKNAALEAQLSALDADAKAAEEQNQALQAELDARSAAQAQLEADKQALEEQVQTLTKQAEDAVQVSELLHKAIAANDAGKLDRLQKLLNEMEPLKDLLSATELELYESLVID